MPKAAVVQSVFDFAIREINALEQRIAKSEDDSDAMLWDQARQVVDQLEAGLSQRELAQQWINVRTGEPYSAMHVNRTAKTYNRNVNVTPRPRFRDAYNEIANPKNKLSVHHSSETPEHYTPKLILDAVVACAGAIDLDPCSNPGKPNVPAARHFTAIDDGLTQPWSGRVFMNPPYGQDIVEWIAKFVAEWRRDMSEGFALVPSRTDTEWFETLTTANDDLVVCFVRGRLTFIGNDDPAPFPSMVAYLGPKHDRFAEVFGQIGSLWVRPGAPAQWFVSHL